MRILLVTGSFPPMKCGVGDYAGRRRAYDHDVDRDEWGQIAAEHHSLYESLLSQ